MKFDISNNKTDFFAGLIIAGFFIIMFIISLSQFVWIDEGFTLSTIDAAPMRVWHRALIFEGQPPFYYWLLSLLWSINDSVFLMRLFSILAATVSLVFVYRLSKKYIKTVNPLLSLSFFAFLPFVVWTTLEIRVYALVLLLSTINIWMFLSVYFVDDQKPKFSRRILYSLIAVISVYTQYYLVYLYIGNFLFLLINKKWRITKYYLIDMILPVISSIYLLEYIKLQMAIHCYTTVTPLTADQVLSINTHKFSTYLFPFINNCLPIVKYLFVLSIIIFVVSLAGKKILRLVKSSNYFLFITVFLSIAFTLSLFVTDRLNLLQRHTISMLLPLALALIQFIGEIKPIKVRNGLLLLLLFANSGVNTKKYVFGHPKGREYVEICKYIEKNDNTNLPVLCYRNDINLMIKHYGLSNKIIQVPVEINFDSIYDRRKWVIRDTVQLDSLFNSINTNNGFWLVLSEDDPANPAHNYRYDIVYKYDMLIKYVSSRFNVVSKTDFEPGFTLRYVEPAGSKNN